MPEQCTRLMTGGLFKTYGIGHPGCILQVLQQNLWVKKQFTSLILFKAQTDWLKIDERRTSNAQHRMMNGKNDRTNRKNNYSIFEIGFSFSVGRSSFK